MINQAICLAKSVRYAVTDAAKLIIGRALHAHEYDPNEFIYDPDPLVSVYVPTFNRCELLVERCLKSIQAQTYKKLEIIVANHDSSDQTIEYVGRLMRQDYRIRLIHVPRTQTYPPTPENHWFAGPVVPANAALKLCRGDWIGRCDDDDEWTPDHVESLLRFAQHGNHEFVSSAYATHEKVVKHDGEAQPIGGVQTWLMRSYLRHMKFNGHCYLKSHNRVNDTDLAERFRKAGVDIGWLSKVTAHVLPRPGESTIGLKAYQQDPIGKAKHFAFNQ